MRAQRSIFTYLGGCPIRQIFFTQRGRKTWTTNRAITKKNRENYYYISLADSVKNLLVPKIQKGGYIMLYGPRAASKTTHLNELKEQLEKDYCVVSYASPL